MSNCGTRNGYQAHVRNKERACDACREASTAYQRQLREDPAFRNREAQQQHFRNVAATILIERHRAEFRRIVRQLAKGGE